MNKLFVNHLCVTKRSICALRTARLRGVVCTPPTMKEYSSSCTRLSEAVARSEFEVNDDIHKEVSDSKIAWDYDILINGGGIVGVTFAAQILQKTSNRLKIGRYSAASFIGDSMTDIIRATFDYSLNNSWPLHLLRYSFLQ